MTYIFKVLEKSQDKFSRKKKQNERTYVRMHEGEFIGPKNEVGGSNPCCPFRENQSEFLLYNLATNQTIN